MPIFVSIQGDISQLDSLMVQTDNPSIQAVVFSDAIDATDTRAPTKSTILQTAFPIMIGATDSNAATWTEGGNVVEAEFAVGSFLVMNGRILAERAMGTSLSEIKKGEYLVDRASSQLFDIVYFYYDGAAVLAQSTNTQYGVESLGFDEDSIIDGDISIEETASGVSKRAGKLSIRNETANIIKLLHHERGDMSGVDAIGNTINIIRMESEGNQLLAQAVVSKIGVKEAGIDIAYDSSQFISFHVHESDGSYTGTMRGLLDRLYAIVQKRNVFDGGFITASSTGGTTSLLSQGVRVDWEAGDRVYDTIRTALNDLHAFVFAATIDTVRIGQKYIYHPSHNISNGTIVDGADDNIMVKPVLTSERSRETIDIAAKDIFHNAKAEYKNANGDDVEASEIVNSNEYNYNEINRVLEYKSIFTSEQAAKDAALRALCESLKVIVRFNTTVPVNVGDVLLVNDIAGQRHLCRVDSYTHNVNDPMPYAVSCSCHSLLIGNQSLQQGA